MSKKYGKNIEDKKDFEKVTEDKKDFKKVIERKPEKTKEVSLKTQLEKFEGRKLSVSEIKELSKLKRKSMDLQNPRR